MIVKFCDWTDGFSQRRLKNGVLVTAIFYLIAVWLFVLYVAVSIAVALMVIAAFIYFAFKVMSGSTEDSKEIRNYREYAVPSSNEDAVADPGSLVVASQVATMSAASRGEALAYDTTGFIDRQVARVDGDGRVYDTTDIVDKQVRRIDKEGRIYDTTGLIDHQVGRVDDKGRIFDTTDIIDKQIGRIDEYGRVFDTTGLIDKQTGRVDKTED